MIYELEIVEEADLEIIDAYLYYESKKFGLGEKFLKELDQYFERICESPKHFEGKYKSYREAYIRKFPYLIIFEIEEQKVVVYSVFNTPQNPEKKPK
ncbi:type II toxin-antitoxin system RelE/ParE family toxin [Chryseobacterium salivictor]|uniref:ParE toxin of type II toxin-antitoxin system, parDE n=1 Tax=Chryseobacterium salivictor TaxID=2547600 RepID=A0A4P6ZIF7_9FLAO|nr:type II toxin-antitoxin system RelE/ParE family toxin [Chryseobacterium salivictor]QBO59656.1 hypothetical protein NBC122_02856 [Chryseobacterium salivictor]